jgi:hypothetical protein
MNVRQCKKILTFEFMAKSLSPIDSLHSKEQHGNSDLRPPRTQRPVYPSGAVVLPDRLARDAVLDCGSLGAEPDHHRPAFRRLDVQLTTRRDDVDETVTDGQVLWALQ